MKLLKYSLRPKIMASQQSRNHTKSNLVSNIILPFILTNERSGYKPTLLNRDANIIMNLQGDWVILEITYGLHLGGVELPVLDMVGDFVE